ncbi:MAG: hypothetical protein VKJ24_08150 [Synechococcales bacterium]|nr:hypothetical protein [Synechococcales bacterium]
MRQYIFLTIVGACGLWLGACTPSEEANTNPSPSPAAANPTASPSPDGTASPQAAQPFNKPLVEEKGKGKDGKKAPSAIQATKATTVPQLLQPTDPDARARKVQAGIDAAKGKSIDPFASVPPPLVSFKTPLVPSTTNDRGQESGQSLPKLEDFPAVPELPTPNVGNRGPAPTIRRPSSSLSPRPNIRRPTSEPSAKPPLPPAGIPPLPALPQPVLAPAVEVTGVVNIGGNVQAIVKAPNEPTSRYVSVGQRLSNGQILVKRIILTPGTDPVVILEENGVEVARSLGAKAQRSGPTA